VRELPCGRRSEGGAVRETEPWDEEATGMPDPYASLRTGPFNGYGPEAEIFQVGSFARGVRRATGWRRVVGMSVATLLLVSLLGSAVASILELAVGSTQAHVVQSPPHFP
jgi:hypothetical protein